MANVLAFAEQRDGQLGAAAREAVGVAATIAESMGGQVHALVLGAPGASAEAGSLGSFGAEVVSVTPHRESLESVFLSAVEEEER